VALLSIAAVLFHYYSLGSDIDMRGGLHARLCHAFLVINCLVSLFSLLIPVVGFIAFLSPQQFVSICQVERCANKNYKTIR